MDKNTLFDKIISRIYTGVVLLLSTFLSLAIAAIIPLWACYMERHGEKVDAYLNISYVILFIFTIIITVVYLFLRNKQPPDPRFKNKVQKMVNGYFKDIDALKARYKGNWIFVEEWKKQMQSRADNIIKLYQKEGQTEKVWNDARNLDSDLLSGIEAIQDSENPLTKDKNQRQEKVREL